MALLEREVGIAIAATATALSPRAREIARRGAVYGLAGIMKAGDVVVGGAKGAAQGAASGLTSNGGPVTTAVGKVTSATGEQGGSKGRRRTGSGTREESQ